MKSIEHRHEAVCAVYNHYLPGIYENPYPAYEQLRLMGPRVHHPAFGWMILDYELATAVLKDTRFSANRLPAFFKNLTPEERQEASRLNWWFEQWALFQDAPVHTANRSVLTKAFTPGFIESLRPRIQQLADKLVDKMDQSDRFDFIESFACPFPVIVIAELLGVRSEDYKKLKQLSDELAQFLVNPLRNIDTVRKTTKAIEALNAYLKPFVAERRKNPKNDLISHLVQASDNGLNLSDEQIYSACGLMLFAGHETTTNLLANGLLAILQRPYAFSQLASHPELAASAVEEFMRFDGAVQMIARMNHAPIHIDGQFFEPGLVSVMLGAANRDPLRFHNPDKLILDRGDNKHLGFGVGHHFCLGAKLARLEGEIAFKTLLARFPKMRLANEPIEYHLAIAIRALKRLNLFKE